MKTLATGVTFVLGLALAIALAQDRPRPPRPPRPTGAPRHSIEQAISDRAQVTTIAFDGLAFLTGDACGNTFLPPGKVSDFFGFQYMRDIDAAEGGHNTAFLSRIANATLAVLSDEQKQQLIALARRQEPSIEEYAYKRFPLITAFARTLAGDVPPGTALSRDAVTRYSAALYELDGTLAYERARDVGAIVRQLDALQQAALARLKFGDSSTWPDLPDQVDKRRLSHRAHVAVMTYASEMFSWYAGSIEADTYFCPERHGMYFGSFYVKDAPAMGKRNYSISTRLTGDTGEAFLAALNDTQRERITGIVDEQRPTLEEIVHVRREISSELRRFLSGETADRSKVVALSRRYGELDGALSYLYASRFVDVARTLDPDQKQHLMTLRNLDGYMCHGAYLYSDPVPWPEVGDTDFLFGPARSSRTEPRAGST